MTLQTLTTVEVGCLHIIASDFDARPMTCVKEGDRLGYEPDLARIVCDRLGLKPVWHNSPMTEFYSRAQSGQYDVVWFNQAITEERQQWVDFTRPYGLFDEAVLVRSNDAIHAPTDLTGLKVGGLADSTNIALVETFPHAIAVPFPGSDKVLPEMLEALRSGEIDALIDDELVLIVPATEDDSLRVAFTLPTQVPFGIGVRKGETALRDALNETLEALIADGTMAQLWAKWIPWKPFPFAQSSSESRSSALS